MEHPLTRFCVISGVRGVKGELQAFPKTDSPEFFTSLEEIFILDHQKKHRKYSVKHITYAPGRNRFFIRLDELTDRDQAVLLKGCDVLVGDSELPPINSGDIYVHQLMGCTLVDDDGKQYGTVTGYFENGAQGILEVQYDRQELLIPLTDEIITEYRMDEKIIQFKPIAGLIELNFKPNL